MVKCDEWFPKGEITLEGAALEAVKNVTNCLVIAGPGSGKTELLAQKLDYLFSTNTCVYPKKILALSFKKDAASNLKERVKNRYGDDYASRFTSLTYSAFEKRILDQFGDALPENIRPSKDYLIEDWNVIKQTFSINKFFDEKEFRKPQLRSCAENIILSDKTNHKIKNDLLKGTEYNNPVLLYKQITKLSTQIIKDNEFIRKALQKTYEFVFLDEFQDTTDDQYNLLKTSFLGSSCKLTAVGDDMQAIMRWAGANPNIFPNFIQDFNAMEYQLMMNHRSVPKLVEFQKEVHKILDSDNSSIQTKNYPRFNDGEIKLFEFKNESEEVETISQDIKLKMESGLRASQICILTRQHVDKYTSELIPKLSSNGIKARIEDEYQEILKDPFCNFLLDLILCSQRNRNPQIWENINNIFGRINGIDEFTDGITLESYYRKLDDLIREIDNLLTNFIYNEEYMLNLVSRIIDRVNPDKIISNLSIYNGQNDMDVRVTKFSKLLYKEYLQSGNNWTLIVSNFKGENSIPIMTIHKSKGLEFDAVYFIGLEDDAFWNFNREPEEEKRTFFVALSRAKRYLIFTKCKLRKNHHQTNIKINQIYSLITESSLVDKI
ncbi:UvrD-helicase domain-containing protein [Streptococcus uberis]|uniref:UvrD-helicase domain-containing protein n=1 Tax=Streptococcus uberis TaxID=1349 RepID=UPI00062031FA|nr:ATP-dependent helicase [Streptococcus uberis]AUC25135.1 ATP-dependent helicase [Streptococcus uberis]KKF42108.1 DNA helicase [Streptococcus uberis Ab71]KKF48219.1 DNA helicase [Streptococcus uberis C5072]MBY4764446.1 ATP-dependent helicase [Streptococcus uberis]